MHPHKPSMACGACAAPQTWRLTSSSILKTTRSLPSSLHAETVEDNAQSSTDFQIFKSCQELKNCAMRSCSGASSLGCIRWYACTSI